MACHKLDAKGLLQDIDSGSTYNKYIKDLERSSKLDEEIEKLKAELRVLEQLVTIFTIASSVSSTPSTTTRLGQLHSALNEKKKAMQDKVLMHTHMLLC